MRCLVIDLLKTLVTSLSLLPLQVDHSPAINLLRRRTFKADQLLPVQLADVEVNLFNLQSPVIACSVTMER